MQKIVMKNFFIHGNYNKEQINDIARLFLRLFIGSMMLTHGIPKVLNFQTLSQVFPDPLGIGSQLSLICAIGCEVGCSILLIFGAFSRIAALFLMFTMSNAAFIVHASDPLATKELALIYLAIYCTLLLLGSGKYSIDNLLFKAR